MRIIPILFILLVNNCSSKEEISFDYYIYYSSKFNANDIPISNKILSSIYKNPFDISLNNYYKIEEYGFNRMKKKEDKKIVEIFKLKDEGYFPDYRCNNFFNYLIILYENKKIVGLIKIDKSCNRASAINFIDGKKIFIYNFKSKLPDVAFYD